MRKKALKLTLAALLGTGLITCLAGCGEKAPFDIYSEAAKKTNELESAETTAKMVMTLSAGDNSLEMPMNMDIKMSGINTDDMMMDMKMEMEIMGQTVSATSYYTDGYYYMDDSTTGKIRYAMDLKDLQEEMTVAGAKTDLEKDDFEELTAEKSGKEYILTYKLKKDSMNETVDAALGSMGDMLSGADMDIDFSDIAGTMTVNKDGYIYAQTMTIPMSTTVEGQDMTFDIHIDITYVDPGKEVTVELPDDLDTYEETSLSDAFMGAEAGAEAEAGADGTESANDTAEDLEAAENTENTESSENTKDTEDTED